MISAVMALAKSESKNEAAFPTSSIVTLRRKGAAFSKPLKSLLKSLMPEAAKVLMGPAEMPFTRMPLGPNEVAR